MWLGASVAFAFNSLAQGPVTPMTAATSAGLEPETFGFPVRRLNRSATRRRAGGDRKMKYNEIDIVYHLAS